MTTPSIYNPEFEKFLINLSDKVEHLEKKIESLSAPKIKESQTDDYLTREETAKMCGVKSLTTLWNWDKHKILSPSGWAGRKPLYKKQDVIEFIEKGGGNFEIKN